MAAQQKPDNKRENRGRRSGGRREKPEYDQKLLDLARVTRVVKGGRRFRFRATLVIGNRKGKVGVGVAKKLVKESLAKRGIKLLSKGNLTKKLTIASGILISESAQAVIEAAGGKVEKGE